MHGKVSEKIDVYAFGIVLLELLSGKKPINSENPKGQESLVMWVSLSLWLNLAYVILIGYRTLFFIYSNDDIDDDI